MEQGLYAKMVKLHRKDFKFIAANNNKNEAKFKFQGQYARSQRLFDIDFDWIEVNFITREPDFHKKLLENHNDSQDTNTFKIFQVTIGNSKCVEIFKFHNDDPMLKHFQKLLNSCCFISLASVFASIEKTKADNAISFRIAESLKSEVGNHIDFANAILKTNKIKGEPRVYYSPRKYKNMGSFDIMIDVRENVNLVQLMYYLGNANHAISVLGYCIFESNYEKALVLNRE